MTKIKTKLNERQEVIKWESDEIKQNTDKIKIIAEFLNVLDSKLIPQNIKLVKIEDKLACPSAKDKEIKGTRKMMTALGGT